MFWLSIAPSLSPLFSTPFTSLLGLLFEIKGFFSHTWDYQGHQPFIYRSYVLSPSAGFVPLLLPGAFQLTTGLLCLPISPDSLPGHEDWTSWIPCVSTFPIAFCSGVIWQASSSLSSHIPRSATSLSPAAQCCEGEQGHRVYHGCSVALTPGGCHGQGISMGTLWPWPQCQTDLPSQPTPRDAISWLMLAAGHY